MTPEEREYVYKLAENSTTLANLPKAVRSWAREKGFEDDVDELLTAFGDLQYIGALDRSTAVRMNRTVLRLFDLAQHALAHGELGESTEGVRKCSMDDHLPDMDSVTAELADTIIRVCHLHARRMDRGEATHTLGEAIALKMRYNETRPYKHGKKA